MGKYMRKSKTAGDVAVMEVAQSSLGVRTRAKTLALQRLQQSVSGGSYLQLRSRKLEKPPLPVGVQESNRQRQSGVRHGGGVQNPSPNCKTRASSRLGVSSKWVEENQQEEKDDEPGTEKLKDGFEIEQIGYDGVGEGDVNVEAFTGENSPDFHARDRTTMESMPSSFIRDADHVETPGSSTKASNSVETSKRMQNSAHTLMPTAEELEEFFAGAEQQQHWQFMEKYNFDPMNEKPLPGRYDWEKIDP